MALAPPRKSLIGAPPGELRLPDELLYAGIPRVTVTIYDQAHVDSRTIQRLDEMPVDVEPGKVLWISVEGLADLGVFRHLMKTFGIHPLAIEDTLSRRSRPKTESHHDVINIIAVDPLTSDSNDLGNVELVSLFLGDGWVISVEDSPGDTFEAVHYRIRHPGSRLRRGGPDTLLQALVDTLVDRFFPVLDSFAERLEAADEAVGTSADLVGVSQELHSLRQALQNLRRYAWPMREAVNALVRSDFKQINETLNPYFLDVSDHLAQVIDQVEMLREQATSIRDLHFSAVNTKMNEVMRNLTVVSTIFLPLTWIAGVYGMNFDAMPELHHPLGYFICLGVMVIVGAASFWWFRRRKWV